MNTSLSHSRKFRLVRMRPDIKSKDMSDQIKLILDLRKIKPSIKLNTIRPIRKDNIIAEMGQPSPK